MSEISDLWVGFNRQLDKMSVDDMSFLDTHVFKHVICLAKGYDWNASADANTPLPAVAESPVLEQYGFQENTRMYVAELSHLVRSHGLLETPTVLEVGGGFGNFCRVFNQVMPVSSYTILDTPSMLRFANAFLQHHGLTVETVEAANAVSLAGREFDIFVSTICLSETPPDYRQGLFDDVIPGCRRCFIIDGDGKRQQYNEWLEGEVRKSFDEVEVYPFRSPWNGQRVYIGRNIE